DDDELVRVYAEAARRGALAECTDDFEPFRSDSYHLADRIDPGLFEQPLIWTVSEDDDVLAVLQLGTVEESTDLDRDSGALGKKLRRAEHDDRPGLQIAIEHTLLHRRTDARAQLDIDVLQRRGLQLERARIRDCQVGALQQLSNFCAVREIGDPEPLDEDRI